MRNFKLFVFAFAIMVSSNVFAESKPLPEKGSFSYEVAKFLNKGDFSIDEDHKGKVFFSLNKEKKIVVHFVQFQDKEVRQYILEKLQDQELRNKNWEVGKVYSLPLQMKM